jgi:hypothetical protein
MFAPLDLSEAKQIEQSIPTIIVPFREQIEQKRGEQLKRFLSHIDRYHSDWKVIVVEQSDDNRKFNRGALLNIGTLLAEKDGSHHIIFHDVDLLPLMKIVPYYTAFPKSPIHIAKVWTSKYDSPNFLGGVLSMSLEDIRKTNGFPNNFWGWGGEDDAIRTRIKNKHLTVYQPTLRGEGYKELQHVDTRTKQEWKNMTKWEDMEHEKKHPGKTGIKNVKFDILDEIDITKNIKKITVEIK